MQIKQWYDSKFESFFISLSNKQTMRTLYAYLIKREKNTTTTFWVIKQRYSPYIPIENAFVGICKAQWYYMVFLAKMGIPKEWLEIASESQNEEKSMIFPRFVLSTRGEKLGESRVALTLCFKYEK